jgi:hypothetical protein
MNIGHEMLVRITLRAGTVHHRSATLPRRRELRCIPDRVLLSTGFGNDMIYICTLYIHIDAIANSMT